MRSHPMGLDVWCLVGPFVYLHNLCVRTANALVSYHMLYQCQDDSRNKRTLEPPPDKTNKVSLCPAKTQISLSIRPVWSESSLSAWRKRGSLATHSAHSEDSDQTGQMPRLIWVFAGHTCHSVVFIMKRFTFKTKITHSRAKNKCHEPELSLLHNNLPIS